MNAGFLNVYDDRARAAAYARLEFPGTYRLAREGDVMLDVPDRRPVEDILCTDADYRTVYQQAGLTPLQTYRPLAKPTEPLPWVSETTIAPWAIYVLGTAD